MHASPDSVTGQPPATPGARLRQVRKALGYTLQKMGKTIGLSKNHVWQVESGNRNMGAAARRLVCELYGVSEQWLETGKGESGLSGAGRMMVRSETGVPYRTRRDVAPVEPAPVPAPEVLTVAGAIAFLAMQFGQDPERLTECLMRCLRKEEDEP